MGKGRRNRTNRVRPDGLTNAQLRAAEKEIRAQIRKADLEYSRNFAAGVLWAMHKEFGFGKNRLRRMWDAYTKMHDELKRYYELEDGDEICFVCKEKLKEIDVDVDAWDMEG
jgi:hypothetical protein